MTAIRILPSGRRAAGGQRRNGPLREQREHFRLARGGELLPDRRRPPSRRGRGKGREPTPASPWGRGRGRAGRRRGRGQRGTGAGGGEERRLHGIQMLPQAVQGSPVDANGLLGLTAAKGALALGIGAVLAMTSHS